MAKITLTFSNSRNGGSHNATVKLAAVIYLTGECPDDQVDRVNAAAAAARNPKTGSLGARKFVALLDGTTPSAPKFPASVVPGWGKAAIKTKDFLTPEEVKWVEEFLIKGQGEEKDGDAKGAAISA